MSMTDVCCSYYWAVPSCVTPLGLCRLLVLGSFDDSIIDLKLIHGDFNKAHKILGQS